MRKIFGVEEKKAKRAILKNFDKKKGKCACFFHTRAPDGILIINLFRPYAFHLRPIRYSGGSSF